MTTTYMGLTLPTPIIAGASRLTGSLDGIKQCVREGAGAVVLKSIFEEQILADVEREMDRSADLGYGHPESFDYIQQYSRESAVGDYLDLIRAAKRAVPVPVIASVHCVGAGTWVEFAKRAEQAGADGLELNVFVLPSDPARDGRSNEQVYFDVAEAVKQQVSIPVALKIGPFFSALSRTVGQLSQTPIDGLVLFNRFYQPDIDIETMQIVPARFLSHPDEIALPLRWIALLSGQAGCDLCASTGVHDGAGAVKLLLAGAAAVQVASALYVRGVPQIATILAELRGWMQRHEFGELDAFRGRLRADREGNPAAFERVQFMKSVSGIE